MSGTNLRKALMDGTIDCIATHHLPHETDSKVVEFESAAYGMIGLETCYAALKTAIPEITESKWVELLSLNARKIFGLDYRAIQKDFPASVTIYQPSEQIEVNETFFRSRSRNSPFIGKQLKGKCWGLLTGRKYFLNNQLKNCFMEKKTTSPVVAGLLISAVLIVFGLIMYFTNFYSETWNQYVGMFLICGGIIWAVINHGKEKNGNVTFGGLFGFGFKTTAVIICITIVYTLIFGYIFPDVKETIITKAREDALTAPNANESQVEQGMAMFEKNYTLFIMIGIIFWYAIIGAVSSLIGAAVTKKNPKAEFENV